MTSVTIISIINEMIPLILILLPSLIPLISFWQQLLPHLLTLLPEPFQFLFLVIISMIQHLPQHPNHVFLIFLIILHVRIPTEISQLIGHHHSFSLGTDIQKLYIVSVTGFVV